MILRLQTQDGPAVLAANSLLLLSDDGTPFLAAHGIDGATIVCMAGDPEFDAVCRSAGLEVPDIKKVRL